MSMAERFTARCATAGRALHVDVTGLAKRFAGRRVLDEFALRVAAGETIALAGPNGSGKSTALRLLGGLLRADAGSGVVLGCALHRLDVSARNRIGFLPQRAALHLRLPVLENLRFRAAIAGHAQPARSARDAAAALGLAERAHEPLGRFSGGWIRRIELAATMLHRPALLLLDEPTTGLDPAARADIWGLLAAQAADGVAIVFSSHDDAELQHADRIVQFSGVSQ